MCVTIEKLDGIIDKIDTLLKTLSPDKQDIVRKGYENDEHTNNGQDEH